MPTADDICRALEQSAAENALPVEFFARVIWQESRFDAQAVSPKGAAGIAQLMPATASWHGLADPFDPMESLRHSAAYLRELLNRFGNLGLAAAAYNAGPARVSAWLTSHRPLPGETRNYVALVTGWTADEWASSLPPEKADTTIPQGAGHAQLAIPAADFVREGQAIPIIQASPGSGDERRRCRIDVEVATCHQGDHPASLRRSIFGSKRARKISASSQSSKQ